MASHPKRKKTDSRATEEILFDPVARQDYLTGFHKRKLQRTRHARDIAEKKARAERIEDRRKLRAERRNELERHVAEVNALLEPEEHQSEQIGFSSEGEEIEEWRGLVELPEVDHKAEYVDEDRYTSVTVEAMDLSRNGLCDAEATEEGGGDNLEAEEIRSTKDQTLQKEAKRIWTKEKPEEKGPPPKKKRKKFRYENKAERKLTRSKEKAKNSKQARIRRST